MHTEYIRYHVHVCFPSRVMCVSLLQKGTPERYSVIIPQKGRPSMFSEEGSPLLTPLLTPLHQGTDEGRKEGGKEYVQ